MQYLVDERILKKKIIQINSSLQMITKYLDLSYDEYLSDNIAQNIVEYNLFIIINQIIDIANHIVVDNEYGTIETMSDGFILLNKNGFISKKDMDIYIKMVGFRNVIAHQYIDLNKAIAYDVMKNRLKDIVEFLKTVDKNFI